MGHTDKMGTDNQAEQDSEEMSNNEKGVLLEDMFCDYMKSHLKYRYPTKYVRLNHEFSWLCEKFIKVENHV